MKVLVILSSDRVIENIVSYKDGDTIPPESVVCDFDVRIGATLDECMDDYKALCIREKRNADLILTDWTQVADCSLSEQDKQAWRDYRQALRDVTDQEGFPRSVELPDPPFLINKPRTV